MGSTSVKSSDPLNLSKCTLDSGHSSVHKCPNQNTTGRSRKLTVMWRASEYGRLFTIQNTTLKKATFYLPFDIFQSHFLEMLIYNLQF